jgi:hypothetical protein
MDRDGAGAGSDARGAGVRKSRDVVREQGVLERLARASDCALRMSAGFPLCIADVCRFSTPNQNLQGDYQIHSIADIHLPFVQRRY